MSIVYDPRVQNAECVCREDIYLLCKTLLWLFERQPDNITRKKKERGERKGKKGSGREREGVRIHSIIDNC